MLLMSRPPIVAAVVTDVDGATDERRMSKWDPEDARLVNAAITRTPLCVECLIRETGVTRTRVTAILTTIDAGNVTSALAPCGGCLDTKRVFRRA